MRGYLLALVSLVFVLSVTLPGIPQGYFNDGTAYAQAPVAKEAPKVEAVKAEIAVEEKQPEYLDKIIETLKGAGGVIAGVLVAFEFLLRVFPSVRPLSILIPVKYFVDGLAVILGLLSNFLVSLINVANKSKEKLGKV